MNLQYLGDALDHWKGSLLERLQRANLLNGLLADPMASDACEWAPDDWDLFRKLLRLAPEQLLKHRFSLVTQRLDYFREIKHSSDLFLDPDTGIATGRVGRASRYVRPAELKDLLYSNPSRVVAVYQHVRAIPTARRLEQVISVLRAEAASFSCCSYESATVAMLFFSKNPARVGAIHGHHKALLGRHASNRTQVWHGATRSLR